MLLKNRDSSSSMVKWNEKKRKARARWFLAYTLVKNPSLIKFRRTRDKYRHRVQSFGDGVSKTDEEESSSKYDEGDEIA